MRAPPSAISRRRRGWPSRIAVRLLAFNLLLLFLPAAGIFYLDVYEARLLEAQERAMVQHGRLLAAALPPSGDLRPEDVMALLGRLSQRGDARLRVYDAAGTLVGDSNRLRFAEEATPRSTYASASVRGRLLYRLGALVVAARQLVLRPFTRAAGPPAAAGTEPSTVPLEVVAALGGRYGTAIRATPGQRSLTLYSAVPVRHAGTIAGAVLVSQSTFRVLQALYAVRLRIFAVILASVVAAALITTIAAATVVRPLARIRREATNLVDRRSRLPGRFVDAERRDEIGDLARSLQELTRRLDAHIRTVERFAADVSHEFKNPLAAIRSAAEMSGQADTAERRDRFLAMIRGDVDRLERLVSNVRELAQLDTELEQEPVIVVDVGTLAAQVVEGLQIARPRLPEVVVSIRARPGVLASPDRLAQALENVVSNARSFAPSGTTVALDLSEHHDSCHIEVSDSGPGIPAAHLQRIFDRFFSYRPGNDGQRDHAGLGLAIARTIVQGYGGTISATNRAGGGASFEIVLPAVGPLPRQSLQKDSRAFGL